MHGAPGCQAGLVQQAGSKPRWPAGCCWLPYRSAAGACMCQRKQQQERDKHCKIIGEVQTKATHTYIAPAASLKVQLLTEHAQERHPAELHRCLAQPAHTKHIEHGLHHDELLRTYVEAAEQNCSQDQC